jgi:hypothetical protein
MGNCLDRPDSFSKQFFYGQQARQVNKGMGESLLANFPEGATVYLIFVCGTVRIFCVNLRAAFYRLIRNISHNLWRARHLTEQVDRMKCGRQNYICCQGNQQEQYSMSVFPDVCCQ